MDLMELRERIDEIDEGLIALFCCRMQTVSGIAEYKKANGLPVRDAAREEQKLAALRSRVPAEFADSTEALYRAIFAISRDYEARQNGETE